jgi:hypothetical protein
MLAGVTVLELSRDGTADAVSGASGSHPHLSPDSNQGGRKSDGKGIVEVEELGSFARGERLDLPIPIPRPHCPCNKHGLGNRPTFVKLMVVFRILNGHIAAGNEQCPLTSNHCILTTDLLVAVMHPRESSQHFRRINNSAYPRMTTSS